MTIEFLRKRYEALITHPMFAPMEYSEDPEMLREWMPLIMKGRDPGQKVAATRVAHGTDVNFAAVSRGMIRHLNTQEGFELQLNTSAIDLQQEGDKSWTVTVRHETNHSVEKINASFLFVGAGGATLPLLQKADIPEAKGYGGFPVSGQWLVCKNPRIVEQHLHDDSGNWHRAYGNENWEFDENGLMRTRHASINDLLIDESERLFHWTQGPRPEDHPGLTELGL